MYWWGTVRQDLRQGKLLREVGHIDLSGEEALIGRDAQNIIRTVTSAVKYLHDQGIVHRGRHPGFVHARVANNVDLKPENIFFKSKAEDAELALADFGVCL